MKFQIISKEDKTSAKGTKYARATVQDESAVKTEGVAIFSSFPGFNELAVNSVVEGVIKEKEYNGSKSYSLEAPMQEGGARRPNMDRVMEKKADMIQVAQGNKERAVSHAQTRNEIMWAKYGAAEIIAHHEAYKSLELKDIPQAISKLANIIYHDALQPFSDTVSPTGSDYDDMNPEDIPF